MENTKNPISEYDRLTFQINQLEEEKGALMRIDMAKLDDFKKVRGPEHEKIQAIIDKIKVLTKKRNSLK